MIDRPAFAMGSAAHRRTPSSGQRRDGERSDVWPCACCGRTRRAERRAAGAYERAAYSRRDRAGARRLDLDLTLTWLRAMAITEEEKQLREALRASLRTAAIEARSRAASRRLWQDAVAESLAVTFRRIRRSWEEEAREYADLEAATKESALEEARRRQVQLVALNDELFNQVPLWHPLLGMPELRAKILARARWQRALDMLKVCKACCSASGTRAWDYFLMDEVD